MNKKHLIWINKKSNYDMENIILKDQKNEINMLINNKNCRSKVAIYLLFCKYTILIFSTSLIFISSSIENKQTSKTLAIFSGCLNAVILSLDKILHDNKNKIDKLKKKINYFFNSNFNSSEKIS